MNFLNPGLRREMLRDLSKYALESHHEDDILMEFFFLVDEKEKDLNDEEELLDEDQHIEILENVFKQHKIDNDFKLLLKYEDFFGLGNEETLSRWQQHTDIGETWKEANILYINKLAEDILLKKRIS